MNLILKPLIGIALNAMALYGLTYFVEEIAYTGGFKTFLVAGIVIGLLNTFVKPLMKILSLPVVVLSGGLFLVVINAIILWLTSYVLEVAQFRDIALIFPNVGSYVIGGIVFGLLNWGIHLIIKNK